MPARAILPQTVALSLFLALARARRTPRTSSKPCCHVYLLMYAAMNVGWLHYQPGSPLSRDYLAGFFTRPAALRPPRPLGFRLGGGMFGGGQPSGCAGKKEPGRCPSLRKHNKDWSNTMEMKKSAGLRHVYMSRRLVTNKNCAYPICVICFRRLRSSRWRQGLRLHPLYEIVTLLS